MNNPIKSQIAANRERFDEKFEVNKDGFVGMGYIHDVKPYKDFLTTSQTSLLQTAIAAVEGLKKENILDWENYPGSSPVQAMAVYNLALSKVVDLLKGGIEE